MYQRNEVLRAAIESLYDRHTTISQGDVDNRLVEAIFRIVSLLEGGRLRVLERNGQTNVWVKKALLLFIWLNQYGHGRRNLFVSKTEAFERKYPRTVIERGAHIGVYARIGASTIQMGSRLGWNVSIGDQCHIGSCAQIGSGTQIHSGAMLGGALLSPATRVTYLGCRCVVGEGARISHVVVGARSFIVPGVVLDEETLICAGDTVWTGYIPPCSQVSAAGMVHRRDTATYYNAVRCTPRK